MIITSAEIHSYGQLQSRSFDFASEKIIVVYGPNEAGKSTFASFLVTMLFGFSPVALSNHPYYNPETDALKGQLNFISQDRKRCSILRELQSVPRSTFASGEGLFGDELDLRNRSLPQVDHISRRVFEAVYSLGLAEMDRIETKTWDFIQDRLLGGLNMEFLRPVRIVVENLEQEAKSYWRPDRRGKPLAAELETNLRQLQKSLRRARENDNHMRHLAEELKSTKQKIDSFQGERQELKRQHLLATRVQPVQGMVRRINELRSIAGDIAELDGLPDKPLNHLRDIRTRKAELLDRGDHLSDVLRESTEIAASYKPEHARLRSESDQIRSWATRVGRHEASITDLEEYQRRLSEIANRVRPVFDATFVGGSLHDGLEKAATFDIAEIQSAIVALATASHGKEDGWDSRSRRFDRNLSTAIMVVGLIVIVSGVVSTAWLTMCTGLITVAAGAYLWRRTSGAAAPSTDQPEGISVPEVRDRLEQLVRPLEIRSGRTTDSTRSLLGDIVSIHESANEYVRQLEYRKRLDDIVREDRQRLKALVNSVGTDNHASPTVLIARLMRDLEEANYRHRSSEESKRRRGPVQREHEQVQTGLDVLREEESGIIATLEDFGSGNLEAGARKYSERVHAHMLADQLSESLEKEYPDWRDVMGDEVETADADRGVEAGAEVSLDQVQDNLQRLSSKVASIREQLKVCHERPSVSEVENDIRECKDELLSAKVQRDRRMLMAALLRRAESEFRDEHQPDVIRKANEYLKIMTTGRYDRLSVDDLTGELRLWSEDTGRLVDVDQPLSRGTLDQIYLALRLAIVDHLDRNHERIPLFLDEVLVNYDYRRREKAYAILKSIASERQVFIFTCHSWMAEETEELLGAQIVRMS